MLTVITRIYTSERQKTAEPIISKEKAITVSLKRFLKWEKELHTDRFYYEGESRTLVEFWCNPYQKKGTE
jgi:hypothetical protein